MQTQSVWPMSLHSHILRYGPTTALTASGRNGTTEVAGQGRRARVHTSDRLYGQARTCCAHCLLREFISFYSENNGKLR